MKKVNWCLETRKHILGRLIRQFSIDEWVWSRDRRQLGCLGNSSSHDLAEARFDFIVIV